MVNDVELVELLWSKATCTRHQPELREKDREGLGSDDGSDGNDEDASDSEVEEEIGGSELELDEHLTS